MRQIDKTEPSFFSDFIRNEKPKNWEELSPIKERLRHYMLTHEQNFQCAYTELRIDQKANSSHIDHFKRQHSTLFPELRFDYNNIFTAANHEEFGAKYKDKKVKEVKDYDTLLSPTAKYLNDHFSFDALTNIMGKTKDGQNTIEQFKLNHRSLLERRREAAYAAIIYKEENFPLEMTIEYIGQFESLIKSIYQS